MPYNPALVAPMREEMTRVDAMPRRDLSLAESEQRARRVLDIAPHRLTKPLSWCPPDSLLWPSWIFG